MKISLNWLKEFIKIAETPEKIEAILTETGLEVDEVININPKTKSLDKLIVGEIKSIKNHLNEYSKTKRNKNIRYRVGLRRFASVS